MKNVDEESVIGEDLSVSQDRVRFEDRPDVHGVLERYAS
jgi:hypothetical protein